jgi:hypothetical protein
MNSGKLTSPLLAAAVLGGVILLSGCAVVPPSGPSVVALPRSGEPLATFRADDYDCRNYAYQSGNPQGAAQAATTNSVNSSVLGTLGGAAVGALIGAAAGNPGAGAAIGAGGGLLVGSAAGANSAQYSAAGLQGQYDAAYAQCMTSKGNTIQQPQMYAPQPVYYAPPPQYYAPPPPIYYAPYRAY